MEFSYGPGVFLQSTSRCEGILTLGEFKVFLKSEQGEELTSSFVPVDRIQGFQLKGNALFIDVQLNQSQGYVAQFQAEKSKIKELAHDLAKRCGMKKAFLFNQWRQA